MRVMVFILVAVGFGAVAGAQTGSGAPAAASATSAVLPRDIDPQSFSRLPIIKRDDLDDDGKRIYDELAGGPAKPRFPPAPSPFRSTAPKSPKRSRC